MIYSLKITLRAKISFDQNLDYLKKNGDLRSQMSL